jgi:PAS domain S-box-containing protein
MKKQGFLKNRSIRSKLKRVILSTSVLTIILVFAGFFIYEQITYKGILVKDLSTKADIIAEISNAALTFRDSADAVRVLNSLSSQPHIMAAAIYDDEGMIFVSYQNKNQNVLFPEKPASPDSWYFEDNALIVYKPITLNEAQIGTIYLSMDLAGKDERFWLYIQIALLVLIGSLLAAYVVATIVAKNISAPIISLSETAQQVSEQKDYSIRTSRTTNDETGFLADSFNEMLFQIQKNEDALRKLNQELEHRVDEHTEQLNESNKNLVKAQDFLNSIVENIPSMIFLKDAKDLHFIRFNKAGEELVGYSREELIGKNDYDFYPKDEADFFTSKDREVLLNNKMIDIPEEPIQTKNKGLRILHTKKISLCNENGEPQYLLGISEDITEQKRFEEELRESQQKTRQIIDTAHDAFIAIDENGLVTDWNQSAENTFGWARKEIIGKQITETLIPLQYREDHRNGLKRFLITGKGKVLYKRRELSALHKNGREFPIELTIAPVKLGGKYLFSAFARDISERKLLEEERKKSQERIEGLLNFTPDAIIAVDDKGAITLVNQQTEKLFRYTREELLGKQLELLVPEKFRNAHKQHRSAYFHSPRVREMGAGLNLYGRRKDGSEFPVEISLSPFETNEGIVAISTIRDITDRKRAEQALKERTLQLESANQELESFSYSVSHDLRAPLRAIGGYAKMLGEDYASILDQEGNRLLEVIRSNTKQMGALIDDLLALSRLGRKEIRKSLINMTGLAQRVVLEINKTLNHTAEIKIHDLHPAMADYSLINQVVTNLLSNALKYSSKVKNPVIEIKSEKKDKEIIYSVKDNGAGFDMQYVHKLFGVFQRLHTTEEFEGTGVGLAIVNLIIKKHGGNVWAEGKMNEGATFYFTLPVNQSV